MVRRDAARRAALRAQRSARASGSAAIVPSHNNEMRPRNAFGVDEFFTPDSEYTEMIDALADAVLQALENGANDPAAEPDAERTPSYLKSLKSLKSLWKFRPPAGDMASSSATRTYSWSEGDSTSKPTR